MNRMRKEGGHDIYSSNRGIETKKNFLCYIHGTLMLLAVNTKKKVYKEKKKKKHPHRSTSEGNVPPP